jgi:uroporphyrin-III C-methyltransferase
VAARSDGAKRGTAYLVGGGLGDVGLLTVQAKALIQTADVVLFDRLISSEIRALASPTTTVHVARKVPGKADAAQAELNEIGINAIKDGKSVVRVKIGDPLLFARGGEELCVYRAHGFEPVLVPGLSSALVAPLLAKIPVTHRGVANQLLISTGRDKGGVFPDLPDYSSTRTLVLLMAVGKLPSLYEACLSAKAYPEALPVAVIEDASLPTERQTVTTLGEVGAVHAARRFKAPAIVVIGWTVSALSDPAVVEAANSLGPKLTAAE